MKYMAPSLAPFRSPYRLSGESHESPMMTKTMKAAVLHALKTPLVIEQVPIPEPGHGDLLIKVTACGVCHSDLHAVDGDWSPPPVIPLIPGHEVAGRVVKLGTGVTDFKVGDEVEHINVVIGKYLYNISYIQEIGLGICFNSKTQRGILKLTAKAFGFVLRLFG